MARCGRSAAACHERWDRAALRTAMPRRALQRICALAALRACAAQDAAAWLRAGVERHAAGDAAAAANAFAAALVRATAAADRAQAHQGLAALAQAAGDDVAAAAEISEALAACEGGCGDGLKAELYTFAARIIRGRVVAATPRPRRG